MGSGPVPGTAGTAELEYHPFPAQGGPGQRVQPRPEPAAGSVQFPQLRWRRDNGFRPGRPYTYFILEVLAAEVQERQDPPQEGASYSESVWSISGQVLGVYGLQQGLRDPTGWQTDIRFTQYYSDGDAPMRPEAGKRYLLLACTYDDTEWEERCGIATEILWQTNVQLDPWSLDIKNNLIRYDQRTRQEEQVLDETLQELPPDARVIGTLPPGRRCSACP